MFHVGHLQILERAKSYGDRLCVGVSTDELSKRKKGRLPICSYEERAAIVRALRIVDQVFAEDSLEEKHTYLESLHADVLVMGDDWEGRFDAHKDICSVVYLPRTPSISTTALIEKIRK